MLYVYVLGMKKFETVQGFEQMLFVIRNLKLVDQGVCTNEISSQTYFIPLI